MQGDLRLKPIRVRAVQRSRMKEPQEIAREQLAKLEKKLKKATKAGEDDEADRLQTKVDKLKRKLAKSDAAAASEAEPPKKKKKKDKKA